MSCIMMRLFTRLHSTHYLAIIAYDVAVSYLIVRPGELFLLRARDEAVVRVVMVDITGLSHRIRSDVVIGDDETLCTNERTGTAAPSWPN